MNWKGSVQTGLNPFFQGAETSKVIWKSDCEYEWVYAKSKVFRFSMDESIGDSVPCHILDIYGKDAFKVDAKSDSKDPEEFS